MGAVVGVGGVALLLARMCAPMVGDRSMSTRRP